MSTDAGTDSGVRGPMPAGAEADPVGADPAATTPDWKRQAARAFTFCLLAFVGLRLAMLLIGVIGVALFPSLTPVGVPGWRAGPTDLGWQHAFAAWERFDALWFMRIADGGYRLEDGSAAFFPLYPLAIRGVSLLLGGAPLAASTLVSNAAFLAALYVTYVLTTTELSERTARTTVLLMCLFPASHFFLMPYSESLFLLLAVTTFWAARRGRWAIGGAAGGLAGLTRSLGVVLAPALVVEALQQRVERGSRIWPGFAAAGATALGLVVYLGYWAVRAGDWFAPITRQANWERTLTFPLLSLWNGTVDAFRYLDDPNGGYWLLDWLIVVPTLAASVYAAVRLRPAYAVYLWGGLLLPLTFAFEGRPLMSMPRFLLPLFPAFWGLALGLERLRVPRTVALVAGAIGLGILSLLTVNWYYIF
ncbi:MAG TPA: mannosyltransferase family protein [Actinomycetota bacterium]|nr:mannosyltransferase family protein [Actinomycetota bacterium]